MKKLSARIWASFILIGLAGQLAWVIENMYFNVFLYNTISTDPTYIANMVAASAIAATLTTLVMGALSDKLSKRKVFIVCGYILWGFSTMAFGFISPEKVSVWFPAANAVTTAAVLVVIMDCIMTFFGSTANDAAFNAYVTDVTDRDNRGRAESVLAIFPLVAMLIIFGGFDGMTRQGRWREFFLIFGILVTFTGIASAFLIKDVPVEHKNESYFKNITYGFRPSVIKDNASLYISLTALLLFSCAVQTFFPYLIIYIQKYLGFEGYAIVLAVVLVTASVISVASGGFIDKKGKLKVVLPAVAVMFVGLTAMYFVRSFIAVILAGALMMSGYMLVTAIISAMVRDYTPKDKAGHFQGIRMIFFVMLPMLIGPYIGAAVIKNSGETYEELGVVKSVPTPMIFLASALVLLLVIVPILILKNKETKK
ncbi:MAG: MFS transporter [Oscillospiraceae bacterium]